MGTTESGVTNLRELEAALAEAVVAQAASRERLQAAPDDADAQEAVRRAENELEQAKEAVRRVLRGP
jgi:hypothetical protein